MISDHYGQITGAATRISTPIIALLLAGCGTGAVGPNVGDGGTPSLAVRVVAESECTMDDTAGICRAACDGGSQPSCANLGVLRLQAGQHVEAYEPLKSACDAGVALGCGGLGTYYGLQNEPITGRAYMEKGCTMGDGLACESLGGLTLGLDGNVPEDVAAATVASVGFYRKACELGATRGCGWVGAAIIDGIVDGSVREALDLYVVACRGRHPMPVACTNAVTLLWSDKPDAQEIRQAMDPERLTKELLKRGCRLGDKEACSRI